MAHTPGPWHTANGIHGKSVCGPIQMTLNGGGTTAPCICKMGVDNEENARLIAAAPDLLAACKALAESNMRLDAVVDMAARAIRKAEPQS